MGYEGKALKIVYDSIVCFSKIRKKKKKSISNYFNIVNDFSNLKKNAF